MLRHAASTLTLLLVAGAAAATDAPAAGPLRDPWSRGSSRFVRQWQLLGALPSPAATSARLPDPSDGGSGGRSWAPHSSFSDVLEVPDALGLPLRRPRPEVAYAHAVVNRDHEGEAVLSLGHDGGVRVWAEGRLVCERPGPHVFFFDDVRVPVRLKRGPNPLLIELAHERGPWRLSLRVLEPGTVLTRVDEIAPVVETASAQELVVRTHTAEEPKSAAVQVAAVAAGGRVVAEAKAARGARVRFDVSGWPDGAYELRCTTRDPWDQPRTRHLAWYKGDAIAAARRLVAAAERAPSDPAGATVKMLAELVLDRLGGALRRRARGRVGADPLAPARVRGVGAGPARRDRSGPRLRLRAPRLSGRDRRLDPVLPGLSASRLHGVAALASGRVTPRVQPAEPALRALLVGRPASQRDRRPARRDRASSRTAAATHSTWASARPTCCVASRRRRRRSVSTTTASTSRASRWVAPAPG